MPKPQVRIVHQGGPAQLMRVFVGEEQLLSVAKVELVLDASDHKSVSARLTIHDVDLDVVADLGAVQTESRDVAWSDDAPATLHVHSFAPTEPGQFAGASCSCGLTWERYESAGRARTLTFDEPATTSAGGRPLEDGGPELFIPADAPGGYIEPRIPDGT